LLVLLYTNVWVLVFFFLFYLLRYGSFPVIYPEMMVLGVVYVIVIASFFAAIKISLSQTIVFASYYQLVAMILSAVFLGEWNLFNPFIFSGQKTILGICLAFIAMVLLLRSDKKSKGKLEKKWLYYILVYIIFMGIATFWSKSFLIAHGPLETLCSQQITFVPVALAWCLLKKKKLAISSRNQLLSGVDGLVTVFAVVFFYQALKNGPVSFILPIQTLLLTIATMILGLVVYKESHMFTREKIIGLVVGIAGIIFLII
jgi:uncharacterized membrane protein